MDKVERFCDNGGQRQLFKMKEKGADEKSVALDDKNLLRKNTYYPIEGYQWI